MKILIDFFTAESVMSTFIGVLILIMLGYIFRRKNILTHGSKEVLTTILLKVAIPCIAFNSFMTEFDRGLISVQIASLCISAFAYAVTVAVTRLCFARLGREKAQVISLSSALGQVTLFSLPVIKSLYEGGGGEALITINTVTINFRIMLYVYSYFVMSGIKFDKKSFKQSMKTVCLNPIVIATAAGLIIYLLQDVFPAVTTCGKTHSAIRIDLYYPPIYSVVKTLASLVSPLAMLLTGVICGEYDLKKSLKTPLFYAVAFMRTVIVPLFVLAVCCAVQFMFGVGFDEYSLTALVISFSAPLSAVICAYSVKYRKEEELSSGVCLISVLFCLLTVPCLCFLCKVIAACF